MSNKEDQLAEVLGINRADAHRLLRDCDFNVEAAIAAGLSAATAPDTAAAPSAAGPSSAQQQQQRQNIPANQLLDILPDISMAQAADLLRRSGQSVEQAANLYFEQGAPSLPHPNINTHTTNNNNNANNEGEVVTIDDSSTSEEEEEREEEEEEDPPGHSFPNSNHLYVRGGRGGYRARHTALQGGRLLVRMTSSEEEKDDDRNDGAGASEREARYTEENPILDGVKVSSGFEIPSLIDAVLKNKFAQADNPPPDLDRVNIPFRKYRKPPAKGKGGGGGGNEGVGRLHFEDGNSLPDKHVTRLAFPMVLGRLNFPIPTDLMKKNASEGNIDKINQVMQNFPECFDSEKQTFLWESGRRRGSSLHETHNKFNSRKKADSPDLKGCAWSETLGPSSRVSFTTRPDRKYCTTADHKTSIPPALRDFLAVKWNRSLPQPTDDFRHFGYSSINQAIEKAGAHHVAVTLDLAVYNSLGKDDRAISAASSDYEEVYRHLEKRLGGEGEGGGEAGSKVYLEKDAVVDHIPIQICVSGVNCTELGNKATLLCDLVVLQQAELLEFKLRLKHVDPSLQDEHFVVAAHRQQQQAPETATGEEEEEEEEDTKAGPSNGKKGKQSAKDNNNKTSAAAGLKKKSKTPKTTPIPLKDKEEEGKEGLTGEMANCIEIEVLLTEEGYTRLSWVGENGSLPPKDDQRPKQRPYYKKHLTREDKERQPLFLEVLSALLLYGGLQVGPDCDGLLNFCDTSAEEADLLDVDKLNAMQVFEARKLYEVGGILDAIIPDKGALTEYHAPPGLIAHPKHYQLAGLQWMVNRERKGDALNRGLLHLHPNWYQFLTPDNQLLYMHHAKAASVGSALQQIGLSGTFFVTPAPGTCGGCLVDDMGLGKTLQMLMLVVTNPPHEEWATTVKRLNTKKKSAAATTGKSQKSIAGEEDNIGAIPIKTTLVVVPATLLNQWAQEIDRHLDSDALKWCYYKPPGDAITNNNTNGTTNGEAAQLSLDAENGIFNEQDKNDNIDEEQEDGGGEGIRKSKRRRVIKRLENIGELGGPRNKKSPANTSSSQRRDGLSESIMCTASNGKRVPMDEMDLCLMSYEQLRDELGKVQRGRETSGLHAFGFWRVVLDEAQLISNTNSVAAIMASSLWRRHAWVCTGTPISQKFSEIQGLLEFLSYQPYMEGSTWRELLENPLNAGLAQSRRAVVSASNAAANASGCEQSQQEQQYTLSSMYGLLRVRSLLRTVMLRRSKSTVQDELELPPCLREDLWVDLSPVEKLVYEQCRREFVDAVFNYMRTVGNNNSNNRKKNNVSGKATGNALSTLTALRQSCCHPQIVGRRVQAIGKERLSMKQIMAKLVFTSYNEWDMGVRRLIEAEMIHAGVLLALDKVEEQRHPAEMFGRLMLKIRANAKAALSTNIRTAAMEERRMDGGVRGVDFDNFSDPKKGENGGGPHDKGKEKAENGSTTNGTASGNGNHRAAHESLVGLKNMDSYVDMEEKEEEEGGGGGADGGADAELRKDEETIAEGEAKKEGVARYRFWKRVELSMLELYHHILSNVPIVIPKKKMVKTGRKKKRGAMSDDREDDTYAFFDGDGDDKEDGNAGAGGSDKGKGKGNGKGKGKTKMEKAAEAAIQAERERVLARPGRQKEIAEVAAAVDDIRAELGLALGPTENTTFRRSKRAAGVGVLGEVVLDEKEVQEQIQNSKIIVRTYNQTIHGRQHAGKSADTAVAQTLKDVSEAWHNLQHLLNKQDAFLAAENEKNAAEDDGDEDAGAQAGPSGGGTVADLEGQEDLTNCPICLDDMINRSITPCGHHFHPECIRECLAGNAQCPICRKPLKEKDLLDACSEEEAKVHEEAKRAAELINNSNSNQDFGAKVCILLEELAIMKSEDADSKAVVFSSWSKLLKLVGVALDGAGVEHATLCGASAQQRQAALHRFLHDPNCMVLTVLMSTGGGAAGLTLTNAQAAFIMEPSMSPGLEQQAAARIYRLGQTKQTRVVRILAKNTVEERLLEVQKKKLQSGSEQLNENIQEVSSDLLGSLYNQLK